MAYAKLLNELIEKSGLSTREIAKRCEEQGQAITPSYISILRKESNSRVPSEDMSRILARVLGANEDSLVLEAYLENAPEPLVQLLRNMYSSVMEMTLRATNVKLTPEQKELFMHQLDELPLSYWVLETARGMAKVDYSAVLDGDILHNELEDGRPLNMQMLINAEFPVMDDAMAPVMPQGSSVKLELKPSYVNGDIVAFTMTGSDKLHFRKLRDTPSGLRMLIAYNSAYEIMEYDAAAMSIVGRAASVCTTL